MARTVRRTFDGLAMNGGMAGGLRRTTLVVALIIAAVQPQSASAWPCRWRAWAAGPSCVRPFACAPYACQPWGFRPFCGFGSGVSSYSYRSFSYGSAGFFTSGCYPSFCQPSFCFPPAWSFSCYSPCTTWTPVATWDQCGTAWPVGLVGPSVFWYPITPVMGRPLAGGFPGAIAPLYGPAGVAPFLGLGSAITPRGDAAARNGNAPLAAVDRAAPVRRLRDGTAVRVSNSLTRLRAERLVAVGDRHMRAAVAQPARLLKALDAYRRAATVAPDLPDTFLRQAIALTALDRGDDAGAAVGRAVAIDARLADDEPAAIAAEDRPPPDPVFGDRPIEAPPTLAVRSGRIVNDIFTADRGDAAGPNWIADRWSRQWRDRLADLAKR